MLQKGLQHKNWWAQQSLSFTDNETFCFVALQTSGLKNTKRPGMSRQEQARFTSIGSFLRPTWTPLLQCLGWAVSPDHSWPRAISFLPFINAREQVHRLWCPSVVTLAWATLPSPLSHSLSLKLLSRPASECSGTLPYSSELAKGSSCVLNVLVADEKCGSVRFRTGWLNTFWPSSHSSTFQKWDNRPLSS